MKGFFGHPHPRLSRSSMLSELRARLSINGNVSIKYGQSSNWLEDMSASLFNLGKSRTLFSTNLSH